SIGSVVVDGVSVGSVSSYSFSNVSSDHTISANFTAVLPSQYVINASAGPGGSISPFGSVFVNRSADQAFVITPFSGYSIGSVVVDGVSVGSVSSYSFSNVSSDHTISANFTAVLPSQYVINASAGLGGTISPSGSVFVNRSADQAFVITPSSGYSIGSVMVDGISVGSVSSYLFSNVSSNHVISATFSIVPSVYHTIISSADNGGEISPSGTISVLSGGTQRYICGAQPGYLLQNVLVDSIPIGPTGTYIFEKITADHTIRVVTHPANSNLTAGFTNSTTTGLLPINVNFLDTSSGNPDRWSWNFGDKSANGTAQQISHSFTASGSYVVTLSIGNSTTGQISSVQRVIQITGRIPVTASFIATPQNGTAPLQVNFTDTSAGDDVISYLWTFGDGSSSINQNPVHSFSNPGLYLVNLSVSSQWNNSTTERWVQVSGAPGSSYTISASSSQGGSITPSGSIQVFRGTTQSFIITPESGYEIASVTVDGINQGTVVAYTFANVTADHEIKVEYRIKASPVGKHAIIATADAGSTIQPSGRIEVTDGSSQTFRFWPGSNSQLNTVLIDGIPQGSIREYTFSNVTADHTVSVNSTTVGLIADFIGSPNAGKSPLTVNFSDMSAGSPSSWLWRFGDGTFSSEQNPVHTYTRTGTHTVSLTVKNPAGSALKTERDYITVSDKNWQIIATTGAGGIITPSGTLWYPQGTTQSFSLVPSGGYRISDLIVDGISQGPQSSWTFRSIGQNHTIDALFSRLGGDTPVITGVHPDHGKQGVIRQDITITGKNIEDQANVTFTLKGTVNLTTSVRKTGSVVQVKDLNLSGASVGIYDLTITNPGGLSGVLPRSFTVTGPDPVIPSPEVVGVNPDHIIQGSPVPLVQIIGQYFYGGEQIEFILPGSSGLPFTGIGQISGSNLTLLTPDFTLTSPGTYDLKVTNLTTNLSGIKYGAFTIETRGKALAPVVSGVSPSSVPKGSLIPVFTIIGENFGATDRIDLMRDGVSWLSAHATVNGSDLLIQNLSTASLLPGSFDIWVTNLTTGLKGYRSHVFMVTGDLSKQYTIRATANTYGIIRPSGDITIRQGESSSFQLQAKAGADIVNVSVDSQVIPIPGGNQYTFENVNANHTIHLNAAPKTGTVIAGFMVNSTHGEAPMTVQFTDTSSGTPTAWFWKFGDGTQSSLQHPQKTYLKPGTYTVSLYARSSKSSNLKQERGLIRVSGGQNADVVSGPVLSGLQSPIQYAGQMEVPGIVVPKREILVANLPL
ncbi:MAG TPA: PKD domain-containing protein, partial [Methanospirillum sp.]|nr:PKD domain-containing protein [Methanospirillum sp.]